MSNDTQNNDAGAAEARDDRVTFERCDCGGDMYPWREPFNDSRDLSDCDHPWLRCVRCGGKIVRRLAAPLSPSPEARASVAEDAAPATAGEIEERLREAHVLLIACKSALVLHHMADDTPVCKICSPDGKPRLLDEIAAALAAPPPADAKGGEVAQIRRAFTYIIGHTGHLPGANAELLAGLLKRCAGYANHGVALVDALASDDTVTALRQALKRQEDALWNILNRQTRDGVATVSERDLREGIRLIRDALRAPSPTEGTPTASDVIGTEEERAKIRANDRYLDQSQW